ncbi:lytic transglycosylase domain-containing protein [Cryobacterium sp. PH29-G1]|uniref:aggregation-promoting factor C-terminal-like domain-containing protein n=1 Tax=Cryobacterium sp. PH29-G1 TaxID=3046211 RepID=UPI0024BBDB51|nr:lytic transglycosylase domain-containing protein [Cryobacterium sp. PH29-G1]MDJ0349221.1 lytic transglycosylase domain-containing protein [Cryobacterium sp. PH29-G1]
MGRHLQAIDTLTAPVTPTVRRTRTRVKATHFLFGFTAAFAFVLVTVVDPYSGATASPYFQIAGSTTDAGPVQAVLVAGSYTNTISRDGYSVTAKPEPVPEPEPIPVVATPAKTQSFTAPSAAVPDPGSAQAYAYDAVASRGWGEDQYNCLVSLWQKESGWRVNAQNGSSGAYGIPQALPGSKMATAGEDWATNAGTQIEWGLGYITGRYGTPCGAWAKSQASGWY